MARSRAFYEGALASAPIDSDDRLSAYAMAGRDVLLLVSQRDCRFFQRPLCGAC